MIEPSVLHESAGVIAILKPAGLPTQAPTGIDSAESWVRRRLHGGGSGYLGVPHRLDRAVSGVLLLAATPRAARKLSRQFERREVGKTYAAIVACTAGAAEHVAALDRARAADAGSVEWRNFVEKVPDEPRARLADRSGPTAREAVTTAWLVGRAPTPAGCIPRLLLELAPLTGRMHQLRLQAAARGMPVVGDDLYGGGPEAIGGPAVAAADPRTRAIALHARRIAFADPDTGQPVAVEAPLPADWPAVGA